MTKNIALGVLGALVLILGIIGINKYKKNNSIDLGLGFGNIGIGSGEYKGTGGGIDIGGGGSSGGKTKKGQFLKCTQYSDDLSSTIYVEFRNNKFYKMVQYKIDATIPANYMNEHTKKEIEAELARYFICANDQDYALCGNLKFKWNNRNLTMTFGVDMSPLRDEIRKNTKDYFEMSIDEFWDYVKNENKNTQCEKVSKAPMYATKSDPKGTYYNKYKEAVEEYNKKNERPVTKKTENSNSNNSGNTDTGSGTVTTQPVKKLCDPSYVYVKSTSIGKIDNNYVLDMNIINKQQNSCKISYVSIIVKDKSGKKIGSYIYNYNDMISKNANITLEYYPKANLANADETKTVCAINKMLD